MAFTHPVKAVVLKTILPRGSEMKKVLLINPPTPNNRKFTRNIGCAAESKGSYLLKPVDFILISGILSKHADVSFWDYVSSKRPDISSLESDLKKYKPSIIIVAMIDAIFENDLSFLKNLKEVSGNSSVYCLGDAFIENKNVELVLPYINGIIANPFLLNPEDFINEHEINTNPGLYNHNSFKLGNKKPVMVEFPPPLHHLFDDEFYKWPFAKHTRYACLTTVWGCPYSCRYCTAARFPFHYRSYKNIIQELEVLKDLKFRELYITDLSFGLPLSNITSLLNEMKKFNFSWSSYFHPNQFSESLVDLMSEAGCHTVIIGVETSNIEILKEYQRNVSHDTTRKLVAYCHKKGIEVCGDFLLGLSQQDKQEMTDNITLAKDLKLDYASFNLVAPLPGTVIREEATKKDIITDSFHEYDSLGGSNILSLGSVASEELSKIRNRSLINFYMRPRFLLSKIISRGSFSKFMIQSNNFIKMFLKAFRTSQK
jgi:radical SAM superfamily enzyme YgiQ (UPF0313 family)